jgi:hypothetical protein
MHCNTCAEPIESDSRYCRFCGASQPQRPAAVADGLPAADGAGSDPSGPGPVWIIGSLTAVACIAALALTVATNGDSPPPSNGSMANVAEVDALADVVPPVPDKDKPIAEEVAPPAPVEPWSYTTTEDKVRGATSYFATATSTNSVELDPPYDGGSDLRMTVRQSPANGADVILRLTSGQLLCRAYDSCYATVRFDDRPAERVELVESSDNSSDTVFVSDAAPFIATLKRSKKVIVELEIYEAGRPQFEFEVAGLKWNH